MFIAVLVIYLRQVQEKTCKQYGQFSYFEYCENKVISLLQKFFHATFFFVITINIIFEKKVKNFLFNLFIYLFVVKGANVRKFLLWNKMLNLPGNGWEAKSGQPGNSGIIISVIPRQLAPR